MKKFVLKQNKTKPFVIIGILSVIGIMLLFSGRLDIPFASILQLVGVGFIVGAVSIFTGSTVTGGVVVAINDDPDDISAYPKLFVYTTKGEHNITGKSVMIKFTDIVCLETGKRTVLKKRRVYAGREYIYANFMPEDVYVITYEVMGGRYELFCDIDDQVAFEIAQRMEKYQGVEELEE